MKHPEYCLNGQKSGLRNYVSIHIHRKRKVRFGGEAEAYRTFENKLDGVIKVAVVRIYQLTIHRLSEKMCTFAHGYV